MTKYTPLNLSIVIGYDVTGLLDEPLSVESTAVFKECVQLDIHGKVSSVVLNGWTNLSAERVQQLQMDEDRGTVDDSRVKTVLTYELNEVDPDLSRGSIESKDCVYTAQGWHKARYIPLSYDGNPWEVSSNVITCYVEDAGEGDPPMTDDIRYALTSLRYRATVSWTVYKIL